MKFIWGKGLRQQKNTNLAFTWKGQTDGDATLEICAVNLYRLYVNGRFFGYGPARTAHGHVRRDVYDLSAEAENGELILVAEVFGANVNSYYLADEPPFFGAALTAKGGVLAETEDFTPRLLTDRVQKVQRYGLQRPFAECYRMERCRTGFYLGDFAQFPAVEAEETPAPVILPRGVPFPTYEYVSYQAFIECGRSVYDPEIPAWKDYSMWAPEEFVRRIPVEAWEERISDEASRFVYTRDPEAVKNGVFPAGTFALYTFGRDLTGFFKLRLRARRKSVVYLLWDEIIKETPPDDPHGHELKFGRNVSCCIVKYTLEKGDYTLQSFEAATGQYARVVVMEGEVELWDLGMVLYESPLARDLELHTGDRTLLEIVRAARHSWEQNAVDLLTDCPGRERAGWLCDTYFSGRAEGLLTGRRVVERNYLENYAVAPQLPQLPEGMIPMCYPADHYNKEYNSNWAMWYIIELLEYHRATGDDELIARSRAKVDGILKFFEPYFNGDGLLEDLHGIFVEWSRANDPENQKGVNYPTNMLFSAALTAAGLLYGDEKLVRQAEKMRETIEAQSFNGKFFEDNRTREDDDRAKPLLLRGHHSETCQYYAFFFGVGDFAKHRALLDLLFTELGPTRDEAEVYPDVCKSNAFIGNYLRLELLLRDGRYQQCLNECKDFFAEMAAITGSLFEHNVEERYKGARSLNHGFASVAANYILEATDRLADASV